MNVTSKIQDQTLLTSWEAYMNQLYIMVLFANQWENNNKVNHVFIPKIFTNFEFVFQIASIRTRTETVA